MIFRRFGMGLLLITFGFALGVLLTWTHPRKPIATAGGSATGNAIEIAQTKLKIKDSLISIPLPESNNIVSSLAPQTVSPAIKKASPLLFGIQVNPKRFSFNSEVVDPDGDGLGLGSAKGNDPWEGRIDSISQPLDTNELQQWLQASNLTYKRVLVVSSTPSYRPGVEGLSGPYFNDIGSIPGGIQAGDLLLYREGVYTSSTQIPEPGFKANSKSPLILLGWPGENVTLSPTNPLDGASHWHMINLQWNGNIENAAGIRFIGCRIQKAALKQTSDIVLQGNLFPEATPILELNSVSNVTMQANLFHNQGIAVNNLQTDSLIIRSNIILSSSGPLSITNSNGPVSISKNIILSSGQGCIHLDSIKSDSVFIEFNSIWNRAGCPIDSCNPAFQIPVGRIGSPVIIRNNYILDQGRNILSALDSNVLLHNNTLFSRPNPPPAFLIHLNKVEDPGFGTGKEF